MRPIRGRAAAPVAALLATGAAAHAGTERASLAVAEDAPAGRFGAAVAVSGDVLVVGAPWSDPGGVADAGAAYVFRRAGGGWSRAALLAAPDAQAGDRLGWAVAVSGDVAVVGAPFAPGFESVTGAAYVFERDAGGPDRWGVVARLEAGTFLAQSFFGVAVGVSGGRAVVGAHGGPGEAYLFERDRNGPGGWGRARRFAGEGAEHERFGSAVAIDNDTVLVAAGGVGAVHVFRRNRGGTDNWGRAAVLSEDAEGFGASVDVGGAVALVGAAGSEAAFLYVSHVGGPGNWGRVAAFAAPGGQAGDGFGIDVAVDRGLAVIGAWRRDWDEADAGAAYLFERIGPRAWTYGATLRASDGAAHDEFGRAVAVDAGTIVAGAWRHAALDGAAYLFDDCAADVDGDGRVDAADLIGVLAAWGTGSARHDVDADGVVGIGDFAAVLAGWGPCG